MLINSFDVDAINKTDIINLSGSFVYFLIMSGDIVYIGKTTNLMTRLVEHKSSGKIHDEVRVLKINSGTSLDDSEFFQILIHKPKYNLSFPDINLFVCKSTIMKEINKNLISNDYDSEIGYEITKPDIVLTINNRNKPLWVNRSMHGYENKKLEIISLINELEEK